jgi:hypothetical protein
VLLLRFACGNLSAGFPHTDGVAPERRHWERRPTMRKRQPDERKLRTREHVLADLSINHVERQILLCAFAVNRMHTDYGIDLLMLTYTPGGEVENGHVLFQVKATDSLQPLKEGTSIAVRIEVADLKLWQDEWMPVILAVYDGQKNRAYWLYMQEYIEQRNVSGEDVLADQHRVTVRIPVKNRLNRSAIERFAKLRQRHVDMLKGNKDGNY